MNEIIQLLEVVKEDPKNLGELSKIALGKYKLPTSFKEGIEQLKYI
tara:strand:- start:2080 stop:2217 length:138 start_codon:yes stop_codon:yes gene_type:complete